MKAGFLEAFRKIGVCATDNPRPLVYTLQSNTRTHTHTHACVDYEVIELDSQKQTTEMMSSNPSYMPNTDASINYGDDMYSYIDPKNVRILARNPIVVEDEVETDQDQHIYY